MAYLDKLRDYIQKIKGFRIAAMILVESAMQDVVLTLKNVSKYGVEIEGNPILREISEYLGAGPGLLIPKILALGIVIYTAYRMNKINYEIKGEYLLYGASVCWLSGAVAHLFMD